MANEDKKIEEAYVEVGKIDFKDLAPLDVETAKLMKDELKVSNILALIYGLFIVSVPFLNWYVPKVAFAKVWGGMTYTWLATTVLAMLLAFIIAATHIYLYSKRMVKTM